MSAGEDYVRITGRLGAIRQDSFMLSVGESVPRGAWIPRSLIHGADDIALNKKQRGEVWTVRMFRWKAEQEGFAGDRDDRTLDLF